MVCQRCIMIVKAELKKHSVKFIDVRLGEVEMEEGISTPVYNQLKTVLNEYGLDLIKDRESILVEKIMNLFIQRLHSSEEEINKKRFSDYLSEKLNMSYTYLSNFLSAKKGITIRDLLILHKIERAKSLLLFEGLTISEVAWKLNYSSVAHLSNQFKKLTGYSPSNFKKTNQNTLVPIESI